MATIMAKEFLEALEPPLSDKSREKLLQALSKGGNGLETLSSIDSDGLKELGIASPLERATLLSAAASHSVMAPPPKCDPPGPVVIEVKIGFTELGSIDTVNGTYHCRFFLDLFWTDPRLVGCTSVPAGTWHPEGIYVVNAQDDLTTHAYEAPILIDSATGRLLWAQDIQGTLTNHMSLEAFPFDSDKLELLIHQAETANRSEYVLRPFGGGWNGYRTRGDAETHALESRSVQCFFDVSSQLDEWKVRARVRVRVRVGVRARVDASSTSPLSSISARVRSRVRARVRVRAGVGMMIRVVDGVRTRVRVRVGIGARVRVHASLLRWLLAAWWKLRPEPEREELAACGRAVVCLRDCAAWRAAR
jgi:hypothetical protein